MTTRRQPKIAVTLTNKQRDAVYGALQSLLATDDLHLYLNDLNDPVAHDLAEQLADAAAVITALDWHPESTARTIAHGTDRIGLRDRLPAPLRPLPHFAGDALQPQTSGGDLCIQACADNHQVAFHAIHTLARAGAHLAAPRWSQPGFRESAAANNGASHRNLFGFNEGIRKHRRC